MLRNFPSQKWAYCLPIDYSRRTARVSHPLRSSDAGIRELGYKRRGVAGDGQATVLVLAGSGVCMQILRTYPFVSDGSSSFSCHWKEKTIALRVVTVVAGHLRQQEVTLGVRENSKPRCPHLSYSHLPLPDTVYHCLSVHVALNQNLTLMSAKTFFSFRALL